MKKLAIVFVTILFVACSTEGKQIETVKDLAKKDITEKLQLPEGTAFADKDIEVSESKGGVENLGALYIVKITIKSQNADGSENIETHILTYKKLKEGGLAPEDYELQSFE